MLGQSQTKHGFIVRPTRSLVRRVGSSGQSFAHGPPRPGVVSALGGLVADLRGDFIRTVFTHLSDEAAPQLREALESLAVEGRGWLAKQGHAGAATLNVSADMRYVGQSFEIEVPIQAAWIAENMLGSIEEAFHAMHARLYDFHDPDGAIEIVNLRLSAIGAGPALKGVMSLLAQKAYLLDGDKEQASAVPTELATVANSARELLFDGVAAADDDLAEKYLEEGALSEDELASGLKAAFARGVLVPVLCGNPISNIGASVALELIRSIYPAPSDRPPIVGTRSATASDPHSGQWSGKT